MKIGLAQINTTVGDIVGNRQKIILAYRKLCEDGAELVLFTELVITGYPPRDLLFKSRFVPDNVASLLEIAAETGDIPALIGYVARNTETTGRPFYNAAAWCEGGKVKQTAHKCLLPTYDVFDEDRYFESSGRPQIITYKGLKLGITICEDIWTSCNIDTGKRYNQDPVEQLADEKIDILLNLSSSPWHNGKSNVRESLVKAAAERCGCPVFYCNAIGGNDELIFDGNSLVVTPEGKTIGRLNSFKEDLQVIASDVDTEVDSSPQDEMESIHDALTLGLRDYAHKSGFKKALLGLSGGIDSAITAAIAVDALGSENVIGISLPSSISSQHSKDDAATLAKHLGITYHQLPIAELVEASERSLSSIFEGVERDITEENIQARSRGVLLMAVSNKFGALLLTTGNKSELAVGYCTLYGDMAGGLAVISDLPKIKVYALALWMNREKEIIPWNSIEKAPSAELRPDQKDEDSLPPYDILDQILEFYVEEGKSSDQIIAAGFDEAIVKDVIRKVDLNEYKRKQAAPGLKITPLAFGIGRRIPIVQRYVS